MSEPRSIYRRFVKARIVRSTAQFYPAQALRPHHSAYYEQPDWEEYFYFGFYSHGEYRQSPVTYFVSSSWHFYARYNSRRSVAEFASTLAESDYRPCTPEQVLEAYEKTTDGRLPKLFEDIGTVEHAWEIYADSLFCEYFASADNGYLHYFPYGSRTCKDWAKKLLKGFQNICWTSLGQHTTVCSFISSHWCLPCEYSRYEPLDITLLCIRVTHSVSSAGFSTNYSRLNRGR